MDSIRTRDRRARAYVFLFFLVLFISRIHLRRVLQNDIVSAVCSRNTALTVWSGSSKRPLSSREEDATRSLESGVAGSFHRQVSLVTIPSTLRRDVRCTFSRGDASFLATFLACYLQGAVTRRDIEFFVNCRTRRPVLCAQLEFNYSADMVLHYAIIIVRLHYITNACVDGLVKILKSFPG